VEEWIYLCLSSPWSGSRPWRRISRDYNWLITCAALYTGPGGPKARITAETVVKVLGTFQTCSHRTALISFALGACSGHAASNAWQEMSQCFSCRIHPYLRMNPVVRLMTHYIEAYMPKQKMKLFLLFYQFVQKFTQCVVYSWYKPSFVNFW